MNLLKTKMRSDLGRCGEVTIGEVCEAFFNVGSNGCLSTAVLRGCEPSAVNRLGC